MVVDVGRYGAVRVELMSSERNGMDVIGFSIVAMETCAMQTKAVEYLTMIRDVLTNNRCWFEA